MKFLVLITARAGSRRLKNKNLLKLNKKSLLYWSISHAKKINENKKIVVSTDSKKILNVANKCGVNTKWIRPKMLAKSISSSESVIKHAFLLEKKNGFAADAIIILQPTTPFRFKKDINKCIKLFKSNPKRPVISVTKIKHPTKLLYPMKSKLKILKTSKSLFMPNGSVYIINSKQIFKTNNYLKLEPNYVEFKGIKNNIDVDTFEELALSRLLFSKNI